MEEADTFVHLNLLQIAKEKHLKGPQQTPHLIVEPVEVIEGLNVFPSDC